MSRKPGSGNQQANIPALIAIFASSAVMLDVIHAGEERTRLIHVHVES
jgi:hypothetical protein